MATAVFLVLGTGLLGVSLVGAIYWQARADQARPVDAIVVLGTAQFNGRPGRVLQARLDRALAAYERGLAPRLVVTGGRAPGDVFTEAEAARDYLLQRGVPEEAILLENEGRDSWGSMQGVASLLGDLGQRRVLLVSDGFHLFRVKLMARDLGLVPFGAAAPNSPIRQGGPGEFSYVLREAAAVVVHLWWTR
ncbi:MAG: YdcF family protein [Chloroflexota bacterium]|nr:YdcF family protein [Chloroflexota bacterium]